MRDIATLTADELRNLAIDFEHNWTDRARAICELHRRAAEYDKVDAAIADRGVPERDCRLPLPERVDNLIVELKNWRHECAVLSMREEVQAKIDALTGRQHV